ncbi:unnamed protein product [Musa acuminata var. zebrina]
MMAGIDADDERRSRGHARLRLYTHASRSPFHRKYAEGLKEKITQLAETRTRNGIHSGSALNILASDADLYMAMIDGKIMIKLGSRYDVGNLVPSNFHVVASGNDYCVWEKR